MDLALLSEGDPLLFNVYNVIVVSASKHTHVKQDLARRFADFVLSAEGQQIIADFGKDHFGEALFFTGPAAKPAAGQ